MKIVFISRTPTTRHEGAIRGPRVIAERQFNAVSAKRMRQSILAAAWIGNHQVEPARQSVDIEPRLEVAAANHPFDHARRHYIYGLYSTVAKINSIRIEVVVGDVVNEEVGFSILVYPDRLDSVGQFVDRNVIDKRKPGIA